MSLDVLKPVSTLMTRQLITVHPRDTVKKAIEIFRHNRIHHIPVVEYKKLVGLVSKSDVLPLIKNSRGEEAEGAVSDELFIGDIMVTGLAVLSKDDKIDVAIEIFKENILHAIPVLDGDELVGLLTTHDIICALGS